MARRAGAIATVLLFAMSSRAWAARNGYAVSLREHSSTPGIAAVAGVGYTTKHPAETPRSHSAPTIGQANAPSGSRSTGDVVVPVFTHACAPTHTVTGATIAVPASAPECLLASLAAPDEKQPEHKKHHKPAPPSPEELARQAADRAIALAPKPKLRVAPRGVGLAGLPSYFWLAQRPRSISATAGVAGLTVTAQARPIQYVWHFGDGDERVTRHSGRRWGARRPGNIAHVYEARGSKHLSVEVIWEARWRIGAGPWRPLGYFSNSDTRRYPVRQVVAVLVRPH